VIRAEPVIVFEPDALTTPRFTIAGSPFVLKLIVPLSNEIFAISPLPETRCMELFETHKSLHTDSDVPKL
jgi:hypothetical protein